MGFKFICYNCIDIDNYIIIGEFMDSSKIEIFNQVGEDIPELETVEKVLYSAIEKEKLEGINFNLIIHFFFILIYFFLSYF